MPSIALSTMHFGAPRVRHHAAHGRVVLAFMAASGSALAGAGAFTAQLHRALFVGGDSWLSLLAAWAWCATTAGVLWAVPVAVLFYLAREYQRRPWYDV